jgi:surface antigen
MAHGAETSSLQSNKLSCIRPKPVTAQLEKMCHLSATVDQAHKDFEKQVASITENHHRYYSAQCTRFYLTRWCKQVQKLYQATLVHYW